MGDVPETVHQGLLRSQVAWLLLAAGPVALGCALGALQLASVISSSAECGDNRQDLCAPSGALVSVLFVLLPFAGMVFSLIWLAWELVMPLALLGLVILWITDRRPTEVLVLGGAVPGRRTSVLVAMPRGGSHPDRS